MPSNLHGLASKGVSIWSDQISRAMLDSGELARRVADDAVSGVTSNPTIFAGAIVGSDEYTDQIEDLRKAGMPTDEIVRNIMAADIARACDVLARVHADTDGSDGFVSVEVTPLLADDTHATIEEAREWVKTVDRPNLLVKVPATPEGVPAISALTAEGISVNVTLIFSLQRYDEVMDAYLTGLEDYVSAGGDAREVFSVASFFVSRFDTEVDRRLTEMGGDEARSFLGKTAVANARAAYGLYLDRFGGDRFDALASKGARRQKPLWASTSTKNPAYRDLLYVEDLVAPGTVNTMPLETIDAYQDHGDPDPTPFSDYEIAQARADLDRLTDLGIDYDDVVGVLEREGVDKFAKSWHQLLEAIEA